MSLIPRVLLTVVVLVSPLWWSRSSTGAESEDVAALLAKIRAVRPMGEGHADAVAAWPKLATASVEQLPQILGGMDGADLLVANWIRAAVETIVERHLKAGGELPLGSLEEFLADQRHEPRARRLAYELIQRRDDNAEDRLIPELLNDHSMELRYDAVAWSLRQADALSGDPAAAKVAYLEAFRAARDVEQVKLAAKSLDGLGVTVDLPKHFGFLMSWKLIGPFDNTGNECLDVVYPPEEEVNLNGIYDGKIGPVRWTEYVTEDDFGVVDLNAAFDRPATANGSGYEDNEASLRKCKGSIAYGVAEFFAKETRDVELRMGCITAHKVWLNGELVIVNEVFHAGMAVDQYVGKGRLKQGRNTILVKISQNEQTESWAQRWSFQLRLSDPYGTAVLSAN